MYANQEQVDAAVKALEDIFKNVEHVCDAKHYVETVYTTLLLLNENLTDDTLPLCASQHYLLALNALEQAQRYLELADYHRARGD